VKSCSSFFAGRCQSRFVIINFLDFVDIFLFSLPISQFQFVKMTYCLFSPIGESPEWQGIAGKQEKTGVKSSKQEVTTRGKKQATERRRQSM
jgi:hypothetical protein